MLTRLGLQNYEKNFRKGLLTDTTLPLLTDRWVANPALMSLCHLNNFVRFHFFPRITVKVSFLVWLSSALRDVKIPPGPRLLILDHINRYMYQCS